MTDDRFDPDGQFRSRRLPVLSLIGGGTGILVILLNDFISRPLMITLGIAFPIVLVTVGVWGFRRSRRHDNS